MIILLIPGGNRGCKRDRGSFFFGSRDSCSCECSASLGLGGRAEKGGCQVGKGRGGLTEFSDQV